MVMPMGWMKTTCRECGWNCTTYQPSDVVNLPRQCRKCGSTKLEHVPAGEQRLLGKIMKWLR